MIIAIPIEERARLRAEHAGRHPGLATLPLAGDGGQPVTLEIAIANPRGAVAPVDGVKTEGVWALMFGPLLKLGEQAPNLAEQIMAECVIYPDGPTLAKHVERWPDLSKDIANAVINKIAMQPSRMIVPASDEAPPAPIAEALVKHPTASWRRVRTSKTEQVAIAIEPPSGAVWRMTKKALSTPTAWKAIYDLAVDRVKACSSLDGLAVPIVQVFDRFPGIAALMIPAIAALVGVAEEIELGEL